MRQFNKFESFFANDTSHLVGKAVFMDMHANPVNVYDSEGTTLGNTVYTTQTGRLEHQVFLLDDMDYKVFFYAHIGEGTMSEEEIDEPSAWLEVGSCIDRHPSISVDIPGCMQSVNTMAGLRTTNPNNVSDHGGVKMVALVGYNEPGDKPVSYYKFDYTAMTGADDGGSFIPFSNEGSRMGAWVLMDVGDTIDCRHFGVFPNEDNVVDTNQRYALQRCEWYAQQKGVSVYMPTTSRDAIYYDVSTLELHSIICGSGATLVNHNDTRVTKIYGFKNGMVNGESFELNDSTLFTSMNHGGTDVTWNCNTLVVDSNIDFELQNARAVFTVPYTSSFTMDSCEVFGRDMLKTIGSNSYSFKNMEVTDIWFADRDDDVFVGDITLENCTLDVDKFDMPENFVLFKDLLGDYNYGDFGGRELSDVTFHDGAVARNFQGSIVCSGSARLWGFSGTLQPSTTPSDLELNDCDTTMLLGATAVFDNIVVNRGSLKHNGSSQLFDVKVNESCEMHGATLELTIKPNAYETLFAFYDCKILKALDVRNLKMERCSVDAVIIQRPNNQYEFGFDVRNCDFGSNGKHTLTTDTYVADTYKVVGSWVGNTSSNGNQVIILNREYFKSDDSEHSYVYEGNEGGFLGKTAEAAYEIPWHDGTDGYQSIVNEGDNSDILDVAAWHSRWYSIAGFEIFYHLEGVYIKNLGVTLPSVFTIGEKVNHVDFEFTMFTMHCPSRDVPTSSSIWMQKELFFNHHMSLSCAGTDSASIFSQVNGKCVGNPNRWFEISPDLADEYKDRDQAMGRPWKLKIRRSV